MNNEEGRNGETALAPMGEAAGASVTARHNADGSRELVMTGDTASAAVAAQIQADTLVRTQQAINRPRDILKVREKLLSECKRAGFAKVARYSKPVGGNKIVGPSIRFAEAALRAMGNIATREMVIHDDKMKRIVRVVVVDLETNVPIEMDLTVEKTVERKTLKQGQTPISRRTNSDGEITFTVAATDDDMQTKKNAMVSKALRNALLRILPGDVLEDCMAEVVMTMSKGAEVDVVRARTICGDDFAQLNPSVTLDMLQQYLGHSLSTATPAELTELHSVYQSIRDSESTWELHLETKNPKPTGEAAAGAKGMAGRKAAAAAKEG